MASGSLGVDTTGRSAGGLVLLVVAVGTTLALLGFALVQAATTCALVELDAGRGVNAIGAYRRAFGRIRPLLGGLLLAVAAWLLLSLTTLLIPVAIWLTVRWLLLAQAVEAEGARRSAGFAGAPGS